MKKKFIKRDAHRFKRLKNKWRKARGRDNKIREKRKGYPRKVSIGFKQDKKTRGKIDDKELIKIGKVSDLEKVKNEIAVLGKMGRKKKLEIAKKSGKIRWLNFNVKKFLKENKRQEGKKEISKEKK